MGIWDGEGTKGRPQSDEISVEFGRRLCWGPGGRSMNSGGTGCVRSAARIVFAIFLSQLVAPSSMSPPDSPSLPQLGTGLPSASPAGLPHQFLGNELGEILQAYRPYLLGMAWQMLPKGLLGKVAPSDVVQETLLRGYREFPEFTGHDLAELIAWVRQILVHQVADHVRRFDADKRNISREVRLLDDLVDAQALSPSQPLLSAEEWHHLESGLNRLSTLHREVILLRHREGYTFHQIGDLLGKSPDAVRKLWERAVQNLQHLLGTER